MLESFPQPWYWRLENLWKTYDTRQTPKTDFAELFQKYANGRGNFYMQENPNWTTSSKTVFVDEQGKEHLGLQHFSCMNHEGKPIFLVDNHQEVLLPLADLREIFGSPLHLVHIDAHRDDAIFQGNGEKTRDILQVIAECRVSDYLDAGKKMDILGKIYPLTQSQEFQEFSVPKTPFVLNLDIDIYGEEGSAIELELKTAVIAKAWKNAEAICIATSPGFIPQKHAQKILEILLQK